ncbi:helix-turn-helix domain-containing protein [Leucobacter luti]|uniref:helix-turn-helix domain-containing protein n=1 Tax=Leucobacter luti TaxID=340320 RepID=UPI001C693410|nr:helix-turn-helix transcriptional regulator [Leucobacter luti]QYM76174.1 helix-turn-helix domain-containing protein [Leucobacter luti]
MDKKGTLNRRVGVNLRRIRIAQGVGQEAYAQVLGWDRTYVGGLERGERNLTLDTLEELAERVGVDPLELLRGVGDARS